MSDYKYFISLMRIVIILFFTSYLKNFLFEIYLVSTSRNYKVLNWLFIIIFQRINIIQGHIYDFIN